MAAKQDGWQESVNTRKKAVNQERKNENNIIINHKQVKALWKTRKHPFM